MSSSSFTPRRINALAQHFESLLDSDRRVVEEAVCREVSQLLSSRKPVYIENCGILFVNLVDKSSTRLIGDKIQRERITIEKVEFEKCNDLTSHQRNTFPGIVTYSDVALKLSKESLEISTNANTEDLVRGAFAHITKDVVIKGYSEFFASTFGTIFALHNRQGISFSDWFAGADILIAPSSEKIVSSHLLMEHENPTIESAWEPFEAFCETFEIADTKIIDLRKELSLLGFDSTAIPSGVSTEIITKTFRSNIDKCCYVVTNGLRVSGCNQSGTGDGLGCELVVQLPGDISYSGTNLSRLFTMSWIFLQGAKSKVLEDGDIIGLGTQIFSESDSDLSYILISHMKKVPLLQKTTACNFYYMNLTPITPNEREFASHFGAKALQAALKSKGLSLTCKPFRRSILSKSSFEIFDSKGVESLDNVESSSSQNEQKNI